MTSRLSDVVLFSTADWASPYWTNKQHTASRLAARGHRVLYVETVGLRRPSINKLDVARLASRLGHGLSPIKHVDDNLWILSPLTVPMGQRHAAINNFNRWQLTSRITGWLRRHHIRRPLIWSYHPYMLDAAEALDPAQIIYHGVDDIGAIPGVDRIAFDRAERRLLERADLVFATSRRLQARFATIVGSRAHYFGNVADIAHFSHARANQDLPPDLAAIPGPRLGYIGVLSDFKIDLPLLEQLITSRPDWHFVFIGDEREGQANDAILRMRHLPNAHFLGWRPYQDLPRYLHGFSVGLLPQLINDYTSAMFPMKFFEYLAAGLPVVATPLPALAELAGTHGIAADARAFAVTIDAALSGRGPQAPAVDDPLLQANSWDARLEQMLALIEAGRT